MCGISALLIWPTSKFCQLSVAKKSGFFRWESWVICCRRFCWGLGVTNRFIEIYDFWALVDKKIFWISVGYYLSTNNAFLKLHIKTHVFKWGFKNHTSNLFISLKNISESLRNTDKNESVCLQKFLEFPKIFTQYKPFSPLHSPPKSCTYMSTPGDHYNPPRSMRL